MKKILVSGMIIAVFGMATAGAECSGPQQACGPVQCGQTWCPPAPAAPTFVEQKVTAYRPEWKTRKVERTVQKMHTKEIEVPVTWTEWVQESKPVTQKVTQWVPQMKEVTCKARLCEWRPEAKDVMVTKYRVERVQEPYQYQVCERVVTPVKRMVTTYRYEPKEVVDNVQVCRMVGSCVGARCGGCGPACTPVWETCQVKRTVMNCIPEQKEVTVDEVSCKWVTKDGVRHGTKCTPYQEKTTIQVMKPHWVEKDVKKMVCEMVPVTKDVTYNVVSCKPVHKEGKQKRVVCEWRPEKVTVDERYCEMVPYETVVKVPVGGCSQGCGNGGHRGLFGRCGGGCR